MPDLLVPVNNILLAPPTQALGLGVGPGLLSGSGDLDHFAGPGIGAQYGLSIVVTTFPDRVGHDFAEVITFQHPYMRLDLFALTFDGFEQLVESHELQRAQAEPRWNGLGLFRIHYDISPGFEVSALRLILLG